MDPILLLKALILGIVEGLTEFLPISSTGHLILAGDLLNFNDDRGKLFEIVIQFGAILAVVWEYRDRLLGVARGATSDPAARKFILNVFVAFLPLAILGLAFGKVFEMVQKLPASGIGVLMVEQRARQALQISQQGYILDQGSCVLQGPAQGLLADERMAQLYLGNH